MNYLWYLFKKELLKMIENICVMYNEWMKPKVQWITLDTTKSATDNPRHSQAIYGIPTNIAKGTNILIAQLN